MRSLAGVPTIETLAILIKRFSVTTNVSLTTMNDYKESVVLDTFHHYVKPTKLAEFALAIKENVQWRLVQALIRKRQKVY